MIFVRLSSLAVLDVTGKDAARIANNLCTADVMKQELGQGQEAFVTEVRGKAIGHVCIFRTVDGVRMIGAGGGQQPAIANQAVAIAAHLDRYTIREQSLPQDRSDQFVGLVLSTSFPGSAWESTALQTPPTDVAAERRSLGSSVFPGGAWEQGLGQAYQMPWWRAGSILLLVETSKVEATTEFLVNAGGVEAIESEFHRLRIENRFPWYGVDLDASNLPQEADRDDLAISFTKGCYLGQETIARLDSMGQVQKKLVRWNLTSSVMPASNTELRDGDKVVGRLTSVAVGESAEQFVALGFARRSHFEAGRSALGVNADGSSIHAVVSDS